MRADLAILGHKARYLNIDLITPREMVDGFKVESSF